MRQDLSEHGFAIADDAVDADMLERLIVAARRCITEASASNDSHLNDGLVLRDRPEDGPNAIRGLMAPGWGCPEFAEYMASAPVLDYALSFLGCEKEELMMPDADCILYVNPMNVDRAQGWHRDATTWVGRPDHPSGSRWSEEAQREAWQQTHSPNYILNEIGSLFGHNTYIQHNPGAQWVRWELALVDHDIDSGVEYVPGSHKRFRSAFENDVLLSEEAKAELADVLGTPYERVLPPNVGSSAMSDGGHSGDSLMPGAQVIQIKKGQTVYWNGDGLHRGRTTAGKERTISVR